MPDESGADSFLDLNVRYQQVFYERGGPMVAPSKRKRVIVDAQIENECVMDVRVQGLPVRRGKVRNIFDLGTKVVLLTTDRASAFDVVLPNGIPGRGWLVNQISLLFFNLLRDVVDNHVLRTIPAPFGRKVFSGRVTVGKKTKVIPIEAVVRGYLTGSGWESYKKNGQVCGIQLPEGILECGKLPQPIFTPTTKASTGHDESITFEQMAEILAGFYPGAEENSLGVLPAQEIRRISLELYSRAAEYALGRGIIIADTKVEFGLKSDGSICWIDEAFTPESSRFWPADQYMPGRPQPSFDKQFLRDYLQGLCNQGRWDKSENNLPVIPAHIVQGTLRRYIDAYEALIGQCAPQEIASLCA